MSSGVSTSRPVPLSPEARRPSAGPTIVCPPCPQLVQVLLGRRVVEHVRVHGRGDDHRRAGRQHRRGQSVAGQARGHGRNGMRRGRSDDYDVGPQGYRHVVHAQVRLRVEQVDVDLSVGHAAERQRRDELGCAPGHYDIHQGAGLDELACQVDRLVAGDAAGHAQYDVPFLQWVRHGSRIHAVDQPQPHQSEVGIDLVEDPRLLPYDPRPSLRWPRPWA